MSIIRVIREKTARLEYECAVPHFFEEMAEDDLTFEDIKRAIKKGRIRRTFADDPRGTRYEVTGPAVNGEEIAIICRIKRTGKLLFITTYVMEEGT